MHAIVKAYRQTAHPCTQLLTLTAKQHIHVKIVNAYRQTAHPCTQSLTLTAKQHIHARNR